MCHIGLEQRTWGNCRLLVIFKKRSKKARRSKASISSECWTLSKLSPNLLAPNINQCFFFWPILKTSDAKSSVCRWSARSKTKLRTWNLALGSRLDSSPHQSGEDFVCVFSQGNGSVIWRIIYVTLFKNRHHSGMKSFLRNLSLRPPFVHNRK